ncbi:adenine phosphoribosyltransferase [Phytoactinopolyspora halotolerans]|uniref:Adenine phosphoribosyltransferase n=1 Tax=Phytoactinopolyspora halotolerans TaxID=1981512 RepID=A0A6L9S8E6_9ACTN|nr:adenine phosphoribosyltransferase [Phytoactinopolyspora halotolerans]NEE01317.1 adenine phosphoribosyltransferase [Phytoactinopolyspora halotolerans]
MSDAPASAISAADHELLLSYIRDVPDWPEPGVMFKDITPLLRQPDVFAKTVDLLAAAADGPIDAVVGIEARGFILGAPVANRLGAGFVPVRKEGKLPSDTSSASYELEYGQATIEVHRDAFTDGERVLIVDDVLATGGTVRATVDLVRAAGAEVAAVSILMELGFLHGRKKLLDVDVHVLLSL